MLAVYNTDIRDTMESKKFQPKNVCQYRSPISITNGQPSNLAKNTSPIPLEKYNHPRNFIPPRNRALAFLTVWSFAYHPYGQSRSSIGIVNMHDRLVKEQLPCGSLNKYHESDIRYTLQLCQWVLKPIGMWSPIYGRTSISEKIISTILIIACLCSLCFVLIPSGHYTIFREQDMNAKIKLFGPVGFCLTSTIKYCYLGLRGTAFGRCIKHVEADWKMLDDPHHRSIMLRSVTTSRHLTSMSALFLYTGALSYHIALPLLSKSTSGNFTNKPLMYPGYDIFFDVTSSPTYEILFCFHCLYSCITFSVTTGACSLAAIFVTHACGQIQIQMHRLESLVETEMKHSYSEDPLNIIVKDHVRVLRFTGYVDEVLREICLMELVASTLTICLLEYYCMMMHFFFINVLIGGFYFCVHFQEWANSDMIGILTYVMLLISFTFNILIFCYIGELLVDQGGKIGGASYAIEWYNLPSKKALPLTFLIMMSLYPPKLTAGKMFILSLDTFSTVLRSSVVYLNLLRTMTEY